MSVLAHLVAGARLLLHLGLAERVLQSLADAEVGPLGFGAVEALSALLEGPGMKNGSADRALTSSSGVRVSCSRS